MCLVGDLKLLTVAGTSVSLIARSAADSGSAYGAVKG